MEREKCGKIAPNDLLPPPPCMQLNQGPNQGTNAVILYHTGSEQLRKSYDFGEIILVCVATYLTKTDRYSWKCTFLNYVLYNLFWILLMDLRMWLITFVLNNVTFHFGK